MFGGFSLGATRVIQDADSGNSAATALPLTAFFRGNYTGSPWLGTNSTGTSGDHDSSFITATAGTALNGYTPANFAAGSGQYMSFGTALSDYVTATAGSGWILMNQLTTPSGIFGPTSLLADGNDTAMRIESYDAGLSAPGIRFVYEGYTLETTISNNSWFMIQWRFDNASAFQAELGYNGSWLQNTAIESSLSPLTAQWRVGTNLAQDNFYDGRIMEIAITDQILSNQDFLDVRGYINTRYGLSLS